VDRATETAATLMQAFVRRTGLYPVSAQPTRYLWTDAFALCNLLELHARTGDDNYSHLAKALIDQVHAALGRFRADDARKGWLSGLGEQEGAIHPTAAGLRIGKTLPERGREEPFNERLEWDRDGQYFHYLTKWMHALSRAACVNGEAALAVQARELARAAVNGFARRDRAGRITGIYWKMSSDLSWPLVAETGAHDALDGHITCRAVDRACAACGEAAGLGKEIAALAPLCHGKYWATSDPLGLGGLLFDVSRLTRLMQHSAIPGDAALLGDLLEGCATGLSAFAASRTLDLPPDHRLAFRELGLAIGLAALPIMEKTPAAAPATLERHAPLGGRIVETWLSERSQSQETWRAHEDINAVMLATALIPEGFLRLKAADDTAQETS
jgi:hypothetical protein